MALWAKGVFQSPKGGVFFWAPPPPTTKQMAWEWRRFFFFGGVHKAKGGGGRVDHFCVYNLYSCKAIIFTSIEFSYSWGIPPLPDSGVPYFQKRFLPPPPRPKNRCLEWRSIFFDGIHKANLSPKSCVLSRGLEVEWQFSQLASLAIQKKKFAPN